jgi:hypothetical protein
MGILDPAARWRISRRRFLRTTAVAAVSTAVLPGLIAAERSRPTAPWYRRTLRWGQTNITEADAATYDIPWWRKHWRRTRVQGVIINAGGIVAYYPGRDLLQYRPPTLGHRDLLGELSRAAQDDGLVVLARMDSNRTHEPFYQAHPEWFARDAAAKPIKNTDMFVTCVNSPYYEEYIPGVLREIVEHCHPEGFTDNSWSGLGRDTICYCENCRKKFLERTGQPLPQHKDWDDERYRAWILWNYQRRLEIWDLNNRVARAAGGPDCIWAGMNSGSISGQCQSFRDYKEICARAEIIMLDHQARSDAAGFQQNGETGKLVHGLLGWDKLIPESMAMYQAGRPTFRQASKPAAEAHLWMLDGIAGGLQPWWHHVGARQEDRRQFHTAGPVTRWHAANEQYLVNRTPVAPVGLVWSQPNTDFYGRDHAHELVELPWRGWTNALVRARIPYLPVHADHLERDGPNLRVLILPNLAAMSEEQVVVVRRFAERGGSVIATGRTSLYDQWGQPRTDFALRELFGAYYSGQQTPSIASDRERAMETLHSYLRLPSAPAGPIFDGFEETDIIPFGGRLGDVAAVEHAKALLTFVPGSPAYPPEKAWIREPHTDIPGLLLNQTANGSRIAFLPADLDRRFATDNLPDHGRLLANLVRWAVEGRLPFFVEGPGLLDCHLYRQPGRLILHVINLTNTGTWRAPVDELIPVGPIKIRLAGPATTRLKDARLLVAERKIAPSVHSGWASLTLASILDHEVIVWEHS